MISTRAKPRNVTRSAAKAAVLLLLASFVLLTVRAKDRFSLPRSANSHWVSKTCKLSESQRRQAPRARVAETAPPLSSEPVTRALPASENLAPLTNGFLSSRLLRAPPSL